jgi:hypothetical protein
MVNEARVNPNINIRGVSLLFQAYCDARLEDEIDEEDSLRFTLVRDLIAAGANCPSQLGANFAFKLRFNLYHPHY